MMEQDKNMKKYIENKLNYFETEKNINIKKEIEKRIGQENSGEHIEEYIGFDMSKSNSQPEINEEIDTKNKNLLKKFDDLMDVDETYSRLDVWKGTISFFDCPLAKKHQISSKIIKDFSGQTTHDILYWLITEGDYHIEMEKINEHYEKIKREYYENMNETIDEIVIKKPKIIYRYISKLQRYEVCKRQKWRCNQCNEKLKFSKTSNWEGEIAHIDHIHPFSKQESYKNGCEKINESSNLQGLCPECNFKKGKEEKQ